MTKDFKWRKVSEEEKEEIKRDSKKLLNEFASKLEKIKSHEGHFENDSGSREEGEPWQNDPEFRELTFQNAPFIEDDSIIAEKGGWK
jgi:hypothetical protein